MYQLVSHKIIKNYSKLALIQYIGVILLCILLFFGIFACIADFHCTITYINKMESRRPEHRYAYDNADEFYNTVRDDLLLNQIVPAVKLAREVRTFSNVRLWFYIIPVTCIISDLP